MVAVGGVHNGSTVHTVEVAAMVDLSKREREREREREQSRVTYTLLSHEPTNKALESGNTARDERGWMYVCVCVCVWK